jgi:predicted dehydrogenase
LSTDNAPSGLSIALIGCGVTGRRRASAVRRSVSDKIVVAVDRDQARAQAVADEAGCSSGQEWQEAIQRADVHAVIISTSHDALAPVAIGALRHGKHVLVEKPMARTVEHAEAVWREAFTPQGARRSGIDDRLLVVKAGFNHRFHPGVQKAHGILQQGGIGEPFFIRCRYGHGGRPGYEREWRTNPETAGGGELLDQGIHAIDLFRWFLGDFAEGFGLTPTFFWKSGIREPRGRDVEDNAFGLFRTNAGQVASLHASWTQWKNLFSFEVYGRDGYVAVEGLGRTYGPERLVWGRRRLQSGPPQEEHFDFTGPDESWEAEWQEFVSAIREGREPLGNGYDACEALRMAYAVYESSKTGMAVQLKK